MGAFSPYWTFLYQFCFYAFQFSHIYFLAQHIAFWVATLWLYATLIGSLFQIPARQRCRGAKRFCNSTALTWIDSRNTWQGSWSARWRPPAGRWRSRGRWSFARTRSGCWRSTPGPGGPGSAGSREKPSPPVVTHSQNNLKRTHDVILAVRWCYYLYLQC